MANHRNKKVLKLRAYRDKLIVKCTNLESKNRHLAEITRQIRKALQQENTLRAYALASAPTCVDGWEFKAFNDMNQLTAELTLVYRFLSVERKYSDEVQVAARARDYLRVAALTADHIAEAEVHDKMLKEWSMDHGFTRSLRNEDNSTIV